MRRWRRLLLVGGAVCLLLGPTGAPSGQAQQPDDHGFRSVSGVIFAFTEPPPNTDGHTVLGGRVAGPSRIRTVQNQIEIVCTSEATGQDDVVVAPIQQSEGHNVDFWSDDDVTDGFGEVTPTDTARAFRATNATEARVPGFPNIAQVEVRIVTGRFHRLANVVEVDLLLDIRVERLAPDFGLECQTRSDRHVPVRIVFTLIPDDDGDPTSGFGLVGVLNRHGMVEGDRASVARTACEPVSGVSPRETVPPPAPQGRGPFHPCPPEGQTT